MKKGFTLIELLSTIIILSFIALISTTIIRNMVKKGKKDLSIESANKILDAADNYVSSRLLEGEKNWTFTFPDDVFLEYKGTKPESGTLIVDEDGNTSITVKLNGYCIRKRFEENTPSIVNTENCTIEDKELIVLERYREELLNGADPVIKGDLIPVTISSNGTVTYADMRSEWYNYGNRVWANAVILKDGKSYSVGQTIPETDIKQYYVWIPRYRYQLWNVNSENKYPNGTNEPSAINIVFESKKTPVSTGAYNGKWLTHPAFTAINTNGIWVGKFETSYDEATFTDSNTFLTKNPDVAVATNASKIIIKPNVRSLTAKTINQFYNFGRNINSNLNSHIMKNSEWGATAYLTYSLYGKCTETSCEEVHINNVTTGYLPATEATFTGQWQYGATITGCSAASASAGPVGNQTSCATNYAWNGSNNKASTTGNISGIYDMSGGNWEYVMGIIEGYPENEIKWMYSNEELGDATKEVIRPNISYPNSPIGIWYSDYAVFPTSIRPWINRGGCFYNSINAGIMTFINNVETASTNDGFRITLSP